MSYTQKLSETQRENLDVSVFDLMSKFGTRNPETMQWTFDNHQVFNAVYALLDAEEEAIVRFSEFPVLKDHVFIRKELVQRFIKWRLCMSYNDSYFSEPHGELKRIALEMEHAVTRSHDRAAEQRDPTSGETLLTPVIEAKVAMRQRGIPFAQFKEMFPKFLESYDSIPAVRQLEISEKDAADPKGEYMGPNLTFDRLNVMRDFVAIQSDKCAPMVRINPETLLCLIDTVQHHEYLPRDAQQIGQPIGVILPVVGSGTLNLDGAPGVTLMMEDYLQSLWLTGTPPTLNNDFDYYNVAVRRCHDPENVYVFPAAYASNYDGELQDQDGIAFIANGWFDVGQDVDGCDSFTPTLEKGDEVLGWQAMPKYRL